METTEIDPEVSTALELVSDIRMTRAPERVINEAIEAATALKGVLANKKNKFMFRGEQYLQFEDWQTLGRFYGVTARIKHTQQVTYGEASGFEASAEAVRADGMVISAAEAMCMDDEINWKGKPIFQLRSMAQTRASAKALRNVLSWVAVLAGYAPTPAEEMQEVGEDRQSDAPSCPDCGGPMWDNRATKRGRQPDYKCKDKSCDKAVWLDNAATPLPTQNATERAELFKSIKAAGKLLNSMADTPEWTLSRCNAFANENFNTTGGVDALSNAQLSELLKLMGSRVDQLKTGSKSSPERAYLITTIKANLTETELADYLESKKYGPLESLSLKDLRTIREDTDIPF